MYINICVYTHIYIPLEVYPSCWFGSRLEVTCIPLSLVFCFLSLLLLACGGRLAGPPHSFVIPSSFTKPYHYRSHHTTSTSTNSTTASIRSLRITRRREKIKRGERKKEKGRELRESKKEEIPLKASRTTCVKVGRNFLFFVCCRSVCTAGLRLLLLGKFSFWEDEEALFFFFFSLSPSLIPSGFAQLPWRSLFICFKSCFVVF